MKNHKIEDERIIAERRKIQSRGYAWVVTILLISVLVQQFFMRAPFAQYAVEFFILIGCGIYNIIANYKKGIDIWNSEDSGKKGILINTLLSGLVFVILLAYLSGDHRVNRIILNFVTYVILLFIFRMLMMGINNKKQKAIDKELNDDDIVE